MQTTVEHQSYAALLSEIEPAVIESGIEHKRLLAEMSKLMDKEELTPSEGKLLGMLGVLISEYESRRFKAGSTATPLSNLTCLMEDHGLKQRDISHLFGSKGITSEVINGKRSISKAQARKLAEFFKVTVDVFL